MGTTYHIKISDSFKMVSIEEVRKKIKDLLEQINILMSTYRKDSEISKLNIWRSNGWYLLDAKTYFVLKRALQISLETNGAFDITIGPLVNLWGFGAKRAKIQDPPSSDQIKSMLRDTGSNNLELHPNISKIRKKRPKIYLDLAAIAKGYGVDIISDYLTGLNLHNHMVEIGGEVRLSGFKNPTDQQKWRIAIEVPNPKLRQKGRIFELQDISMATSGDYRNFFKYNGKRYSHTIDPRTGYPVSHNLTSVTVFADNCMDADAYATAINVMGFEEGMKWANENGVKSILYLRKDSGFEEKMSDSMKKFLDEV